MPAEWSRSDHSKVAVGFSPRIDTRTTLSRGATPDAFIRTGTNQASLRDALLLGRSIRGLKPTATSTWSLRDRRPRRHLLAVFCFVLLVSFCSFGGVVDALSQKAPKAASAPGTDTAPKTLETKLAEVRESLAEASQTNAPAGVSAQDIWTRRALLTRLVLLYEQQISNAAQLESAKTRRADLTREAQAWTRFVEPPPYSIHLPDRLREELQAERLNISSGEAGLAMLDKIIDEHRESLEQAEEKIRQFQERLEGVNDPLVATRLSWQRDLEKLRSQVAAATVALVETERLVRQENLAASRVQLALLQRQLIIADAGTKFTQSDLDQVTLQIERERRQTEEELAQAVTRREAALRELQNARLELKPEPGGGPPTPRALETFSAREAQLETADTAIRVLRQSLEGANIERTMWELRFAVYGSSNDGMLRDSESRLETFKRRLALWQDYERQQLDTYSSQIQLQKTRLNNLPPDSDLRLLAEQRINALRESDQLHLRFARNIERLDRLVQRWSESLDTAESRLPIAGRVRNLLSGTRSVAQRLWSLEVFTAEDTITVDGQKITGVRSVTVGKIVMAVLILVVGYWLSGLISHALKPIFVRRLKIEANQAELIRRWLRALFVVCLALFSLVSVKIPLTLFAFAGGALAIGLGFGMQTLLKNFVSGIIILFERPFRVGDVLDVSGHRGTVTSVGLRASVLQLWDGTETLIPNSTLLENNLTNWTYSNRQVRFTVTVGVAYGTDARRVIQLLNEVAERHGLVEKEPKPQVFFTDFGDSALLFELRFWVDVSRSNAAQVSSDLRLMISNVFAEHGIEIVFPQRDVHLHAIRPIQVEVVPVSSARPASGEESNGAVTIGKSARTKESRAVLP